MPVQPSTLHLSAAGLHAFIGLFTTGTSVSTLQLNDSLPSPLQDYVFSRLLDKELRLAAMLAWMRLHGSNIDYWAQWFSCLPSIEDVPLLSMSSTAERQILDSHVPHLGARAHEATVGRTQAWVAAVANTPHIWLALPELTPGKTAPTSFPHGVFDSWLPSYLRAPGNVCPCHCRTRVQEPWLDTSLQECN